MEKACQQTNKPRLAQRLHDIADENPIHDVAMSTPPIDAEPWRQSLNRGLTPGERPHFATTVQASEQRGLAVTLASRFDQDSEHAP